jgi:hypothetical protein
VNYFPGLALNLNPPDLCLLNKMRSISHQHPANTIHSEREIKRIAFFSVM